MAKDIYSIEATTQMRIEDIIQLAFDAETEAWGKAVPKTSKEEEKQIKEEEKAVFLWLMKVVHEERPAWVNIWYDHHNGPGAMHLDWQFNKRIEPYEYTSKYGKGYIACDRLIPKMQATGKAELAQRTGSYTTITFSFV